MIVRPSGLQFRIIQNGYGKRPTSTDTVKVYYTGTLINHVIFDGTSPGLPATFKVNQIIPGWAEALQLMREGDHWMIWIPANLNYSPAEAIARGLPPNQTMIFDLRLLASKGPPKKGDPDYVPEPGEQDDQKQ